ncbi:MAG: RDD family protein [Candidatus Woesearchaeota archaeon]
MVNRLKKIVVEAPIWKRSLAFIIDYFIINSLILFPFNNLVNRMVKYDSFTEMLALFSSGAVSLSALIYIAAFMGIFATLYFAIIETRFSSIGKIFFNINIVTLDKSVMTFKKSFLRSLHVFLLFVFPIGFAIDVAWVYFNPQKQRLLEVLSKTKTVQTDLI